MNVIDLSQFHIVVKVTMKTLLPLSITCSNIALHTLFASLYYCCSHAKVQHKKLLSIDQFSDPSTVETQTGAPTSISACSAASSAALPAGSATPNDLYPKCPEWNGLVWVPQQDSHLPFDVSSNNKQGGGQMFVIFCNINLPALESVNSGMYDLASGPSPESLASCIRQCAAHNKSSGWPNCSAVSLDSAGICYLKGRSDKNADYYLVDMGINSTSEGSASAVFIPIFYHDSLKPPRVAGT